LGQRPFDSMTDWESFVKTNLVRQTPLWPPVSNEIEQKFVSGTLRWLNPGKNSLPEHFEG